MSDETSSVIQALAHERRRQIISILGSEGPKGVTELKRRLEMSTGSLYHNLSFLAGIVERTPQRKYRLTRKGEEVYAMLRDGTLNPRVVERSSLRYVEPVFFPRWIFSILSELEPYSFVLNAALIGALIYTSYSSKLGLVLMVPIRTSSPLMAVATSAISYSLVASSSAFIFGLKRPARQFLGPALSLLPQLVYQAICMFAPSTPSITSETLGLILMGYSAAILGASIRTSSNARTAYCLLFAFVLAYLGSVLASMLGGILA